MSQNKQHWHSEKGSGYQLPMFPVASPTIHGCVVVRVFDRSQSMQARRRMRSHGAYEHRAQSNGSASVEAEDSFDETGGKASDKCS